MSTLFDMKPIELIFLLHTPRYHGRWGEKKSKKKKKHLEYYSTIREKCLCPLIKYPGYAVQLKLEIRLLLSLSSEKRILFSTVIKDVIY